MKVPGPAEDAAEVRRSFVESETKYRRLFEAAKDGILILDIDSGRITDVNPFLCSLLGFTAEEMIGNTVGQMSPFKDTVVNQSMLKLLQGQGYVRYENLPLETKDGRRIAVEFVCNVYEAGGVNVIQCNIRDITERKRTERQLQLMSSCVANLNDIVLVTETGHDAASNDRIILVNRAFERITGYQADEAIGRKASFLRGPKTNLSVVAELDLAVAERRPIRRQLLNYKKDGTEVWLDIDIVPVLDPSGECTHFAATERDITEERKSAARIVEQAAFLDKARDAIVVRDLDGLLLYWNEGAERIYGWNRHEALGRNSGVLLELDPRKLAEMNRRTVADGEWDGKIPLVAKDGRMIQVEARCTLIRDDDGQPKSILEIGTDVTERTRLEEQLMRVQRMESIGTLAGGIAHDLNNILAPIMMSIGILKMRMLDDESSEILATIDHSAKRGADIVRQVLSFARGVAGERVEVQPRHILKELEGIIKDTFPKDIRLNFTVQGDIWTVLADPTQVHQVLLNLCVNARDAMPNGGVLGISMKNCVLDEAYAASMLAKPGRYVNMTVADTGSGMEPAIRERIFEPFFTTKPLNKGTGLGLSTVLAIVKGHAGVINIYSELGHGTTVNVYLPASEETTEAKPEDTQVPDYPRGNGELVLVVDDEPAVLSITTQTLEKFGYRTLKATDGAYGVAVFAQNHGEIALVVADLMMPVMDGTAMVSALTRIHPAVKVVMASGLDRGNGTPTAGRGVLRRTLQKPFTTQALLQTVRALLDAD